MITGKADLKIIRFLYWRCSACDWRGLFTETYPCQVNGIDWQKCLKCGALAIPATGSTEIWTKKLKYKLMLTAPKNGKLTERQSIVLDLLNSDQELSQRDIAKRLNVSQSRVSQIVISLRKMGKLQ